MQTLPTLLDVWKQIISPLKFPVSSTPRLQNTHNILKESYLLDQAMVQKPEPLNEHFYLCLVV